MMNKMERNKKTWEIILAHTGNIPLTLHRNLLETHSALHARATADEYPTHAKSFKVYRRICDTLAADYDEMDDQQTAMKYRLAIVRAERYINRKGDK